MNDSSAPPTYEIRDAAGSAVRIGDVISGDFTILRGVEPVGSFQLIGERVVDSLLPELQLSVPPAAAFTFTFTCSAFGSGDGRGGNARDRRRARRAGRTWRSLSEVVRDSDESSNQDHERI